MAWTTFARTDFDANDAGRTGRGDYLVERDTLAAGRPFAAEQFAEFSTTNASYQDAATFTIRTPDFAITGWYLHAHFEVKVAAGSGGAIRLQNVTDSQDGTAQTGISGTSYALSSDLSVIVNAGEHADVNIKVQVLGDAVNLMFVRNFQTDYYYATLWWEPTA